MTVRPINPVGDFAALGVAITETSRPAAAFADLELALARCMGLVLAVSEHPEDAAPIYAALGRASTDAIRAWAQLQLCPGLVAEFRVLAEAREAGE